MRVTVELYGIPRLRAGVAEAVVEGSTLGDILRELSQRFPALGETCIAGRGLRAGFMANLRGDQFVTDPDICLQEGDAVMLLSVDAGG